MTDKIAVVTTCGSGDEARQLAQALVERRLAACVNILPQVRSIYRWEGKIEEAEEWMLLIKSSRELVEPLRQALEQLHSYEVPEMIALPIIDGAPNYLNWLELELNVAKPGSDL